jgi:hypothetical protein
MNRTPLALALLAALSCARSGANTPAPSGATAAEITAADLRSRLFIIAHDSMMGRESGSEGDYKTQEYIASEFKRLGLEPAGENGTYFQTVPFRRIGIDPTSTLSAGGTPLTVFRDFIPFSAAAPPVTLNSAAVVYAGTLGDTAHLIPGDQGAGKIIVVDIPANVTGPLLTFLNRRYANALMRARVQLDLIAPEQVARLASGRPVMDTRSEERRVGKEC